jgi:hypothetical protein
MLLPGKKNKSFNIRTFIFTTKQRVLCKTVTMTRVDPTEAQLKLIAPRCYYNTTERAISASITDAANNTTERAISASITDAAY